MNPTSYQDRLNSAMSDAGVDTSRLAAHLGVSYQAIRKAQDGRSKSLSAANNAAAAAFLGVSPDWLATGTGSRHTFAQTGYAPMPRGRRIPVVGRAQLGDNGHFVELELPTGVGDGYIDLPSDDQNAYALLCVGDSMAPRIKHGEYVVIEPGREVQNGDEVLVKAADGRVMVKQYLYRRENRVHLHSVNEAHPALAIPTDEIVAMHYVAAIVKRARWHSG